MGQNLDEVWLPIKVREWDAVEHIALEEGAAPRNVSPLVVQFLRFQAVHFLLPTATANRTVPVSVRDDLEIAAPVAPRWVDGIEHCRCGLLLGDLK